jgi:hypothetical protein
MSGAVASPPRIDPAACTLISTRKNDGGRPKAAITAKVSGGGPQVAEAGQECLAHRSVAGWWDGGFVYPDRDEHGDGDGEAGGVEDRQGPAAEPRVQAGAG